MYTDIKSQIENTVAPLPDNNYLLGRGLLQPFKPSNSGSRALMSAIHSEHFMVLTNAEVPLVQTGFETEFGRNSTSYVVSQRNYIVVAKINKFSFNPNHYYLIVQDIDTGEYDYIERVTYNHNTESYGYMWDNSFLDTLQVGHYINRDDPIKTSVGFDRFGNKMNGVNLITAYLSLGKNMEDSVIISQSAARKLETCLIRRTCIMINENDNLLNLYGDANRHKAFPDIGEAVEGGIFCSIRRTENRDIFFTKSAANLREINLSDRNILMDGYVCDIDVYCNDPKNLGDETDNGQLYFYYQEKLNFCQQVYDLVSPFAMNGKLTYKLGKLYANCRDTIFHKEYFKDRRFNNVILDVAVVESLPMQEGDKLADRYGGKGVVSFILPDEQMPLLDNGQRVEIIKNQSTCYNRENIGQLHEMSLTFIAMRILDYFHTGALSYTDMCLVWHDFISMIDRDEANSAMSAIDFYDEEQAYAFIESILEDDGIIISTPPFTTPINIDTIREIYKKFNWITQYKVLMPVEDSNGNIRYVRSRRDLVVGKIYNYRLKQYAEEKFSVTSLSATNLKNLNTRSKANKVYETRFKKTPIMFGPMESSDLGHLGMQYVVMNLMLYSISPQGRRLFEQLLIGDPYNIDIRLDYDSKNRNAEIINALFKNCGLRLRFEKRLKQRLNMCTNILYQTIPNSEYAKHGFKTNIRDIIGFDDWLELQYATALQHKDATRQLCSNIMTQEVKSDGTPIFKTDIGRILWEIEHGQSG